MPDEQVFDVTFRLRLPDNVAHGGWSPDAIFQSIRDILDIEESDASFLVQCSIQRIDK